MMSMPSALRLRDIRRVFHLVGEIKELGGDPKAWRLHAVQELVHLLHGQVALSMDMINAEPGSLPTVIAPLHVGWGKPEDAERYLEYIKNGEMRDDPAAQVLFEKMQRRTLLTATRRQILCDEIWYAAPSVYEARRFAGIDDFVFSCARIEPGTLQGFIIYRRGAQRHFPTRSAICSACFMSS